MGLLVLRSRFPTHLVDDVRVFLGSSDGVRCGLGNGGHAVSGRAGVGLAKWMGGLDRSAETRTDRQFPTHFIRSFILQIPLSCQAAKGREAPLVFRSRDVRWDVAVLPALAAASFRLGSLQSFLCHQENCCSPLPPPQRSRKPVPASVPLVPSSSSPRETELTHAPLPSLREFLRHGREGRSSRQRGIVRIAGEEL